MLIQSSLISHSNQQNLFIMGLSVKRYLTVSFWIIVGLVGCLPIDKKSPDCFPDEGCERGEMCIEGSCVSPPLRSVKITLGCLAGEGCSEELMERQVSEACLVIEQPNALYSSPFALDQARFDGGATVSIPLMSGPVRASILILSSPPESEMETTSLCTLTPKDLERLQLHRTCPEHLGCVLRLRREQLSVVHTDTALLELSFSGPQMSCVESMWSGEAPREVCGGDDRDCDGFMDEGLQCDSPPRDLESPSTP